MSSIFIVYIQTKIASIVFILSRIHLIETSGPATGPSINSNLLIESLNGLKSGQT